MREKYVIKLKTLTPIHTGGVDRKSRQVLMSGIIGSVRWWYESLVRALGGFAADPTEPATSIFDARAYSRTLDVNDGLRDVCIASRLFGCTGWRRKFNMNITDNEGSAGIWLDKPNVEFNIELTPTKKIDEEEKWLLAKTFELINRYGSIGGKTTLKPPKMPDFGLVEVLENVQTTITRDAVSQWISSIMGKSQVLQKRLQAMPREFPNLRYFFFNTNAYLDTKQMNQLVAIDRTGFLRGDRGISKKVFSFATGKRFWGYTTGDGMLNAVLKQLSQMNVRGTKTGKEVLNEL